MTQRRFVKVLLPIALLVPLLAGGSRAAEPPTSADDVRPLLVGSTIPDLTLTAADGTDFDMRASIGKKPAVVVFYRGGW